MTFFPKHVQPDFIIAGLVYPFWSRPCFTQSERKILHGGRADGQKKEQEESYFCSGIQEPIALIVLQRFVFKRSGGHLPVLPSGVGNALSGSNSHQFQNCEILSDPPEPALSQPGSNSEVLGYGTGLMRWRICHSQLAPCETTATANGAREICGPFTCTFRGGCSPEA